MKRFYKQATAQVSGGESAGRAEVLLDGRVVRTPAKVPLVVPTLALAEAIAEEWQDQQTEVKPATMPLMQLASTTIDLVAVNRVQVVAETVAYAGSDLLCYRVDQPSELVRREAAVWQPLLDWAALRFDAALHVTTGIMPRSQPHHAVQALRAAVESVDDWHLTGVQQATAASGSLVVGLALAEGRIDPVQAFEASQLHESFQIEQWGADEEAVRRRQALAADLAAYGRWFALLAAAAGPDPRR